MQKLRVASFQRQPLFDAPTDILERLKIDLIWCNANNVNLAVFPECYLQGYASGYATIERRAVTIDSALVKALLVTTADFELDVVLGFAEKRDSGFYNSAAIIRCGKILGIYAKSHPNEAGFKAGEDFPVFDLLGWRYGINICNDANFPEAALKISSRGANLVCYPLNNMLSLPVANKWRSKSIENLQARAIDTACWVISSDVVGAYKDKISYGCTSVVRPDGSVVMSVPEGMEGAALYDIG
jgi:predicted amidohydrolase